MSDANDSQSPEEVVRAFYQAWDSEGFKPAYIRYLAEDCVWENSGFPDCVGKAQTLSLLEMYLTKSKRPYARVEIKNMVSSGNTVLTERVEHCYNKENDDRYTGKLMSVFVVRGGLITRWAEYFDPTDYKSGAAYPQHF
jgi:limonene-1,2-epoxide hydrolase